MENYKLTRYDWLDFENSLLKILKEEGTWAHKAQTCKHLIERDFEFSPKTPDATLVSLLAVWVGTRHNHAFRDLHESLVEQLLKDEVTLKLKPVIVINEPIKRSIDDYKVVCDTNVKEMVLSDNEEEAILRVLALVEEKKKECGLPTADEYITGSPVNSILKRVEENLRKGKETNKEWMDKHAQQWASRRSSRLLNGLEVEEVKASIEDLQAPVIEFTNKIYNELYVEILNRATELQERSKTGDLIPELSGLIEALSIVQSLKHSI